MEINDIAQKFKIKKKQELNAVFMNNYNLNLKDNGYLLFPVLVIVCTSSDN